MKALRFVKIIMLICFLGIGSIFAILVPNVITAKRDRCTLEVSAIVVDLAQDSSDGSLYAPVYEAYIEGEAVRLTSNTYSNIHPDIGDEVQMFVNPDKTSEFYSPSDGSDLLALIFRIVGWVLIGFGVIILFIPMGRRKGYQGNLYN